MANAIDRASGSGVRSNTMTSSEARRAFVKLFRETARYRSRHDVFRDLIMAMALTLRKAVSRKAEGEEVEREYLSIVGRYEKEDVERFCRLFSMTVIALEDGREFLGAIYMDLEIANKDTGQFFTPHEVSLLMAKLQIGDGDRQSILKGRQFMTLCEPACGSGGMVIAFSEAIKEAGIDPQKELWVQCQDVDPLPAMMCYIQLTLLGIPGVVIIGNTLANECRHAYYTFMHYYGGWGAKLAERVEEDAMTEHANVVDTPPLSIPVMHQQSQISLFDQVI